MKKISVDKFQIFIVVSIASLLVACGGGGGEGDGGGTTSGPTGSTVQIAVYLTDSSNIITGLESNVPANDTGQCHTGSRQHGINRTYRFHRRCDIQ